MVAPTLTRDQWLDLRGLSIGSSDAAAACGESRYMSSQELWAIKLGRMPAPDLSGRRSVRRGNKLEAFVLEEYAVETGRRMLDPVADRATIERELTRDGACEVLGWVEHAERPQVFLRSTRYPWMTATLDGVSIHDNDGPETVEAKSLGHRQISDWGSEHSGIAPNEYRLQALHAHIVAPAVPTVALIALIGADDLRLVRERGDAPTVDLQSIVELERYFFECLRAGAEPTTETVAIESLRAARLALHPNDDGVSITLPDAALELHEQLQAASEKRLALEKTEKALKARLEGMVAPHTFGRLPNGQGVYEWRTKSRAAYQASASSWKQLTFKKS